MTETFSQSVTFSILEYPHKRESVGKPLPGMQARIDNPDADGVGEIHLTGPMVMSGYINKDLSMETLIQMILVISMRMALFIF
mgnify:FL=1